ncbi:MAG TPA: hypothetical protein VHB46_04365 [Burkholderiales bacterium]|nr:hypothetical protein [Burkholderiales bacterium]
MNSTQKTCATLAIAAITSLASGCATVVKGSSQGITIKTEPAGAACEINKAGKTVGVVNPTPGTVKVGKGGTALDVLCRKQGFLDATSRLASSFQGWTLGNALIGGVIGIIVDAGSGAMHEYPVEATISLVPEGFNSEASRDAYFNTRKMQLETSFAAVREKIAASCAKDQCDKLLKKAAEEKDKQLAQLEASRQLSRIDPGMAAFIPQDPPKPVANNTVAKLPLPSAQDPQSIQYLKTGDKWTYTFVDRGRAAGSVSVEIVEVRGKRIRERITRDGYKGFAAEREIDVESNPTRFEAPVTLPGGYFLTEFLPYLPPTVALQAGQSWNDVPGQFSVGTRIFTTSQVRVVARETVQVPAGSFYSWRVESESDDASLDQGIRARVKCTFWYAPDIRRTVKMKFENIVSVYSRSGTEFYELAAVQSGK